MRSFKAIATASISLLVNFATITYLCLSLGELNGARRAVPAATNLTTPEVEDKGALISNSTLGFEKAFVINLPTRSDRRDKLTLISTDEGQDISLEWRDGIKGEDVSVSARPPEWNMTKNRVGELGCWRSHMNVLREVVERRYSTALILEDDAAWNPEIKLQLSALDFNLLGLPEISNSSQAYNTGWDVLWLGTCMNPPAPPGTITYQDPVTDEVRFLWNIPGGIACTFGYAVTWKSAREILEYLQHSNQPVDLKMSEYCETKTCPLIWPPLFSSIKTPSDIKIGERE